MKEKDLGVTMNANMKVSEQCRIVASKGNHVIGMICIKITHREKSLIVPLYNAILRKYIDMLEQIQRRAIKLIPGLRDLRYEDQHVGSAADHKTMFFERSDLD